MQQVGRITKCGDAMVRALLYEAANVMMTRCRTDNWLKLSARHCSAPRRPESQSRFGQAACRGAAPHVGRWNRLLNGKANSDGGLNVHYQSRSS
jgi:hypothetical protein